MARCAVGAGSWNGSAGFAAIPSPGRPLNPGGDQQNEQPREGERSARDAANDYVLGLELHNRDPIATPVVSSVLGLALAL